jgi:protein TIF31
LTAIRNAANSVCSLSPTEFDLRFNPDVFSPNVKHAEPDEVVETSDTNKESDEKTKDQQIRPKKYPSVASQIRLNREACDYLLLLQIPTFVRDITANK